MIQFASSLVSSNFQINCKSDKFFDPLKLINKYFEDKS